MESSPLPGSLIVVAAIGLSLAALVIRFRHSSGDTRQQIKWILWGAAIFVATFMGLGLIIGGSQFGYLLHWPLIFAEVIFLGSYGIAVGKYHLYDIDVVINRTVVLAVLAVFITATYVLIVVGLGQLIGGDSDGLLLPIAATAVVAVAFEPVRLRAQRWANRIVYGNRATPYEVLSDLTERLSVAEEGEGILIRLATLLHDGTGADRVTVWLGSIGEMTPAASAPLEALPSLQPDPQRKSVFLVRHDEEVVGALEVIKPRGERPFHRRALSGHRSSRIGRCGSRLSTSQRLAGGTSPRARRVAWSSRGCSGSGASSTGARPA